MRPEQRLTLLARGQAARISKEGIVRWQNTSKDVREEYLKEHPNSAFKDIRVNTLGDRVSKNLDNKAVGATAKQNLIDMGFKKKTNIRDTQAHLADYLKANKEGRQTFAKKGIDVALKVLRKFKPEDRKEIRDEAEDIARDPRKKPSTILNRRRSALIAGVVGIGVCAALFGTGLLDPNIVAFVGIKALDIGISTVAKSLDATSLDEFFIASVIGSFVTSRHGEEYGDGIMGRMKKAYGELMGRPKDDVPDEENEAENKPENDNEETNEPDNDNKSDDEEEPQDITIKKPTDKAIQGIADQFKQAGLLAEVERVPAKPGELQQSVRITLTEGTPDAFRKIASQIGLVHMKTLKRVTPKEIGDSVTGYLT